MAVGQRSPSLACMPLPTMAILRISYSIVDPIATVCRLRPDVLLCVSDAEVVGSDALLLVLFTATMLVSIVCAAVSLHSL